jgi:hypothetical protein
MNVADPGSVILYVLLMCNNTIRYQEEDVGESGGYGVWDSNMSFPIDRKKVFSSVLP